MEDTLKGTIVWIFTFVALLSIIKPPIDVFELMILFGIPSIIVFVFLEIDFWLYNVKPKEKKHSKAITAIASHGKRLVTAGKDKKIILWQDQKPVRMEIIRDIPEKILLFRNHYLMVNQNRAILYNFELEKIQELKKVENDEITGITIFKGFLVYCILYGDVFLSDIQHPHDRSESPMRATIDIASNSKNLLILRFFSSEDGKNIVLDLLGTEKDKFLLLDSVPFPLTQFKPITSLPFAEVSEGICPTMKEDFLYEAKMTAGEAFAVVHGFDPYNELVIIDLNSMTPLTIRLNLGVRNVSNIIVKDKKIYLSIENQMYVIHLDPLEMKEQKQVQDKITVMTYGEYEIIVGTEKGDIVFLSSVE